MDKQENDHQKTKERILRVACEVFAERGFRKTTIRDICQEAQVNVAAVNYYFNSKEKLYEAVCKYIFGLSVENADPRFKLGEKRKPEEKLKAFIQVLLLTVLDEGRSNWREMIMSREMVEPTNALNIVIEDMIKPRFQQLYLIVKTMLGEGVEDEAVRRCCLSITGQCLYYRFCQPVVLQLNPQQTFDNAGIEKLAEHITQFSLHAVKQLAFENKERG
ncbi:MAG: CerR family C-terminal domain-containing protein [Deltaproteobacteria bacterium]|nr:CerR family C-terminal domain-containing protein [Deltaproteobacteria bacterium]MBW2651917.1 CerR family C-terminal domain-containing protein [Deltaproteobacteria bacterium]